MKILRFHVLLFILVFISVSVSKGAMSVYDETMEGDAPGYWKTGLDDIDKTVAGIRKGTVERICLSAGGRPVYRIFYGKPNDLKSTANLSSAMGAGNMKYYADKSAPDYRPTVYLVGATHGGELEGTAALMNLVAILETGKDHAGKEYPVITASAGKMNFIIILCANPDGRARVPVPCMVGLDYDRFRYLSQGTWKDGTLAGWPMCKSVHPILDAADFLGSYYNDDGVNMMHDLFFTDPAAETKALLQTAEKFAPDFTILFHGGDNNPPHLFGTGYLFKNAKETIRAFHSFVAELFQKEGFRFGGNGVDDSDTVSFNLTAAITHVCGEPAIVFESNQGLNYRGAKFSYDEIYRHHMITLEGLCKFLLK